MGEIAATATSIIRGRRGTFSLLFSPSQKEGKGKEGVLTECQFRRVCIDFHSLLPSSIERERLCDPDLLLFGDAFEIPTTLNTSASAFVPKMVSEVSERASEEF